MNPLRALMDLVVDNPIILKDGLFALRRRRHLGALGLAAVGVLVVGTLIWLDETNTLHWAPQRPVGDGLMVGMLGIAFMMAGVLLPAAASATLSGEREHGTLPLLTVTGLSPARIVVGKIVAMVVLAAPFVALPVPFVVLGAVSAGIPLPFVAVGLAGLVVSTFAFAAVGVYGSSLTARSRTSAPAALLGAIVPAVACAIPAFHVVMSSAEGSLHAYDVMGAVAGLVAGAVVTVAAAYGAWSNLAARSANRFKPASILFLVVVVGMPFAALMLSTLDWPALTNVVGRQSGESLFLFSSLFSSAATLLFAAGIGRDQRAPSPLWVVPVAVSVATAGFLGAILPTINVWFGLEVEGNWVGILAVWLHVIVAAAAAAMLGRFVQSTLLAAILGGAAALVVILIPAVADEFLVGRPPLGFVNCVYVRESDILLTVAFWGLWSVAALALARRR